VALDANSLWRDAEVPPLVSSFSEDSLVAARDAVPELPRALLVEDLAPDWLERLARLGCVALDADHRQLTAAVVRAAHAAGYRVLAYTPNELARIAELAGWGVDGIITDAIDRMGADALPPAPPLPR
jgi:glycerophosphoryl diester phosphodiesterase